VPFVRYARDKRGYESTYVMHAYRPGQGPQRARVLYLFRTPAHVKIGRRALEPEVMEALEHTHPDLSFDWTNLPTERPAEAAEPRERDHRREWAAHNRQSGRHGRPTPGGAPARVASGPPSPPPVIEDESLLGRVLGAQRAAQLRGRYADLTLRIGRRSRTPEERDRLLERMQRLNPDEWGDEPAVRTAAACVETEWEAVTAELPGRRRGRRGGRHRHVADGEQSAGSSGIIEDSGPLANQDGGYEDADLAMDADGPVARGERDRDFGPDLATAPAAGGAGDDTPGSDEPD
jgi:hypothetical protein